MNSAGQVRKNIPANTAAARQSRTGCGSLGRTCVVPVLGCLMAQRSFQRVRVMPRKDALEVGLGRLMGTPLPPTLFVTVKLAERILVL